MQLGHAPNCTALLTAWLNWRRHDLVPKLSDVIAEDLGGAISGVSILEVHGPDQVVYRLFASLHADVIGRDLTGENLIDLTPVADRKIRMQRIFAMASHPCGGMPSMKLTRPSGIEVPIQVLILPVRPNIDGKPIRLYMAIDVIGEKARKDGTSVTAIPITDEIRPIDIGFGIPG
jgi:hypothetical protein